MCSRVYGSSRPRLPNASLLAGLLDPFRRWCHVLGVLPDFRRGCGLNQSRRAKSPPRSTESPLGGQKSVAALVVLRVSSLRGLEDGSNDVSSRATGRLGR